MSILSLIPVALFCLAPVACVSKIDRCLKQICEDYNDQQPSAVAQELQNLGLDIRKCSFTDDAEEGNDDSKNNPAYGCPEPKGSENIVIGCNQVFRNGTVLGTTKCTEGSLDSSKDCNDILQDFADLLSSAVQKCMTPRSPRRRRRSALPSFSIVY